MNRLFGMDLYRNDYTYAAIRETCIAVSVTYRQLKQELSYHLIVMEGTEHHGHDAVFYCWRIKLKLIYFQPIKRISNSEQRYEDLNIHSEIQHMTGFAKHLSFQPPEIYKPYFFFF